MSAAAAAATVVPDKNWIGAVQDEWQMFSDQKSDYVLGSPIGFGASSVVYTALYYPKPPAAPIPCAVKVLDLDSLPVSSLRLLTRETQLMTLSKHPNVLRVRGTFQEGHRLYIALRLMNSGSVADVMRYKHSGGVGEEIAKCILKQALQGLEYLHVNGFIHRDVKAANLLIDDDGTVLLGDLGVAADLSEEDLPPAGFTIKSTTVNHDGPKGVAVPRHPPGHTRLHRGKRKSFVGTPCWMAPEVIAQKHYDYAADIWSLGITALELCHGRAPNSRDPPSKILLKTLQNEPPTLDRVNGPHKYSKAFKEIIDTCLVKDPSKRPTATQLLQSPFFKGAKKKTYLVEALLGGLPPLVNRQERVRQGSVATRTSIDSWDFSSTVTSQTAIPSSPTRSIRHIPHINSAPSTPDGFRIDELREVSDGDGEADMEGGSSTRSQSPSLSTPSVTTASKPSSPIIADSGTIRHKPMAGGSISSNSSMSSSSHSMTPPLSSSFPSAFSNTGKLWKKLSRGSSSKQSGETPKKKSSLGSIFDKTASRGSEMMGVLIGKPVSKAADDLSKHESR